MRTQRDSWLTPPRIRPRQQQQHESVAEDARSSRLPVRVIDATLSLGAVPPPRLSTAETSPSGLRRQTPCSPVRVPLVCNGPSQFSTGLCALAATLAALCEACPNQ